MIRRNHAGVKPEIAHAAFVHLSAVVIGNVEIGETGFVGPNAVTRADGPCADGMVERVGSGAEVNIRDGVILPHQAPVEGCACRGGCPSLR